MESKAMNKQFNLAAYFFLLTVLLGSVSVNVCQQEDQACDASNPCCEGLVCLEVSPGVYKCEPEGCEEHVGHPCDPGVRDCCDPLKCSDNCDTCYNPDCTLKLGDTCDPNSSVCCEKRAVCSTDTNKCECADVCADENDCCQGYACSTDGKCVCNKNEGDECNPDACVDECCDLECVAVQSGGPYACKVV